MKFVDSGKNAGPIVEIGTSGEWQTSGGCKVGYCFEDHLLLTISGFLGHKTIGELIGFLEFAKTKLQNDYE